MDESAIRARFVRDSFHSLNTTLSTGVPRCLTRENIRRGMGSPGGFCDTSKNGLPVLAKGRKRPRRSIERTARRGGSEQARTSGSFRECCAGVLPKPNLISPSIAVLSASITLDGSRSALLPDCVGAARHYLCTGDLLPGASAAMMFDRSVLASEQTARAKLLLEPWFGNGRLPDIVEAGILRPARCTRGSRRCLNGWQKT
jgi:hypothetical protein